VAITAAIVVLIALGSTFIFVPHNAIDLLPAPDGYRKTFKFGLHIVVPFIEQAATISENNPTMSSTSAKVKWMTTTRSGPHERRTKLLDASIIYSIDPASRLTWNLLGNREAGMCVRQRVSSDVASQYGVEEIVSTKRGELEQAITVLMTQKFAENYLLMADFVLRDIHFSEEYAAAVEQKQIAEQQSQQAKFVVESKRQEAEQARQVAQGQADAAVISAQGAANARLIEAQAEAQANQLIAQSLQGNPQLIQYLYVQKLAEGVQTIFIPSDNPFILPLPGTAIPNPAWRTAHDCIKPAATSAAGYFIQEQRCRSQEPDARCG
jgi:regulator of protease activity HflC (stomatin/prohibitin superfamily)